MKYLVLIILALASACGKVAPKKSSTTKQNVSAYFKASDLKVKVYYEPGAEPYTTDTNPILQFYYWNLLEDNLKALFTGRKVEPVLSVPKTIGEMTALPVSGDTSWTIDDVQKLASKHSSGADSTTFEIYFVNGYASENANIIGFHINGTKTIVVFKDVIRNTGSGESLEAVPKYVEQATIIHEMGHALGLVNNGVPMKEAHHDSAHGAHCSNENCVMYYTNEGSPAALAKYIKNVILNRDTIMFDDKCLKDTRSF